MGKSKKVFIKKIPLYSLLVVLNDLYEDGVNFIDISGEVMSDVKDLMLINVQPEYMDEDYDGEEQENITIDENVRVTKLSDDDLNSLL